MRRPLALIAVLAWAAPALRADPGGPPPDLAARAWAITDVILDRHVDPPSRQEMFLAGFRALQRAGKVASPPGLARRVSAMQTPEALASTLVENWPGPLTTEPGEGPSAVFLEGLLSVVPGGAELISAREWRVEEQVQANLYVGIQVALKTDGGYPAFQQVLPGGPADQAGAKADEVIEAVDGVSTRDMPLSKVVDRIRGEEGTEVVLRLRKSGPARVVDVPMKRGRLPRKTVQGLSPLPEGRWDVRLAGPAPIGYLKLTEIAGSTPQELRSFAAQMETEGLRALVLDLREAHQATFHNAVLLADALLDGGVIGRVREADTSREIRAEPDALFRGWPMVVLTGEDRSPEVAWLCAALLDNHRATILGEPAVAPDSGEAPIRSALPLPGGEWYLRVVTGRLERGDGQPLAVANLRAIEHRQMVALRDQVKDPNVIQGGPGAFDHSIAGPADPGLPTRFRFFAPANGRPDQSLTVFAPLAIPDDPLPRARAILDAALKSPGS